MSPFVSVRGYTPNVHARCFVADNARVIGDVEMKEGSSVWFNVVIRGDVAPIRIGREVNIQDGSVIHGTFETQKGTTLEDRVTIGHLVMLHGCHIKRGSLIGMNSTIMDGCVVGEHSLIGAGTLLTEGTVIPAKSLVVGRPGKVKRSLTDEEVGLLEKSADNYILYSSWYK